MANGIFVLAFVTLVAASFPMRAQQFGYHIADHLLIREAKWFLDGRPDLVYEGSPYLSDEFETAYVYTKDIKFNAVPMRYNIAADVMEYKAGTTTFELDPDPKMVKVEIGKETFVVLNESFYELIHEGKLSVLAKKVLNFRPKNDLTGVPAKYSRQADMYYLVLSDLTQTKVSNLKNFLEFIPDKKQEVAEFAKTEKLSTRDLDDLLKLAKHYNDLSAAQ
jgi:hypothetical protein